MYSFDDSRAPLYIVRLSGVFTLAELEQLERDCEAMLLHRAAHGCVWDLTGFEFPSREVLAAATKMSKRLSKLLVDHYERPVDGPPYYTAYIVSARIAKLVQFFHRFSARGVSQNNVFSDPTQALTATLEQLRAFGLSVPA